MVLSIKTVQRRNREVKREENAQVRQMDELTCSESASSARAKSHSAR